MTLGILPGLWEEEAPCRLHPAELPWDTVVLMVRLGAATTSQTANVTSVSWVEVENWDHCCCFFTARKLGVDYRNCSRKQEPCSPVQQPEAVGRARPLSLLLMLESHQRTHVHPGLWLQRVPVDTVGFHRWFWSDLFFRVCLFLRRRGVEWRQWPIHGLPGVPPPASLSR